MKESTIKVITADDGKVFARKADMIILGNKLTFDIKFDSADNYIEVDEPVEAEGGGDGNQARN